MTVHHLVEQGTILRKQKLETVISYPRPIDISDYSYNKFSVLIFSYALRTEDVGQLGGIIGILLRTMTNESIYDIVFWF